MSTLKVDAIRHNSATSDAITTHSDGTASAKIIDVGGGALSHRNIIINGAMNVATYGTSSTVSGYGTVNRFETTIDTGDSNLLTQTQNTLTSSDTPYGSGFRNSFRVTNHSSGHSADAADYAAMRYIVEARDIANSGWDYTSSSSNITLSFWVKASVSQNYLLQVRSYDGTAQRISFLINLTAGQWTKVTKTIPGNSGITVNDDSGGGLHILWFFYYGSNYVSGSTTDVWQSGTPSPVFPNTWYTTASSTFEITGVQLEVGNTPTTFEHRSFAEEKKRCERYYQTYGFTTLMGSMSGQVGTPRILFPTEMRAIPTSVTVEYSSNGNGSFRNQNDGSTLTGHTTFNYYTNGFDCRGNSGSANIIYSSTYKADAELRYNT